MKPSFSLLLFKCYSIAPQPVVFRAPNVEREQHQQIGWLVTCVLLVSLAYTLVYWVYWVIYTVLFAVLYCTICWLVNWTEVILWKLIWYVQYNYSISFVMSHLKCDYFSLTSSCVVLHSKELLFAVPCWYRAQQSYIPYSTKFSRHTIFTVFMDWPRTAKIKLGKILPFAITFYLQFEAF